MNMQKRKKKLSLLALFCAMLMIVGTLALPLSALTVSIRPSAVAVTDVGAYAEIPIYLENGKPLAVK